ncbi:DUF5688 family protein [Butyrivibrio proteoclasticus]|uniref:DUF5688 family protein n=1 Tax=Butyrivibrio proteoclasticus TaxID=43305 RepID=UPI00047D26E7|nr:DUF5688 family protein [Butyrivibrio proteoclasticus]
MEINVFVEAIASELKIRLGEDYEVKIKKIEKNNCVNYHGILIRKEDENVAPTIFLDGFYQDYMKGASVEMLAENVLKIYREYAPEGDVDTEFYRSFSSVSDKLSFKLVNIAKNKEQLKDIPYKAFEDLALVPICLVKDKRIGAGSITVKNSHLEFWEISKKELWEQALENANKINRPKIRNVADAIGSLAPEGLYEMSIMVLSNDKQAFGAAVMLNDGVLKELSETLHDDLFIIPSSVHEVLAVPATVCNGDPSFLRLMVKEVNSTVVKDEDVLSDNVYYYDSCLDRLGVYSA